MSLPITRAIIDACRGAGACEAGLRWISAEPRTLAELHSHRPAWSEWLAVSVADLSDAERDELRELTGMRTWWRNGKRHRDDGPAVEWPDGYREWWRDGQRHRDDGPAVERADGYRVWYRDGQRHRDDGPAVEHADGYREWYRYGQWHRDDGPAVEYVDGRREWWRDGKRVPSPEVSR